MSENQIGIDQVHEFLNSNSAERLYRWQDLSGTIPLLQAGPGAVGFEAVNQEAITIQRGMAVCFIAGGVMFARADSLATIAVGLAWDQIAPAASGLILCVGMLELADWTLPSGGAWASLPEDRLFLATDADGVVSEVPPAAVAGHLIQRIGLRATAQRLFVSVAEPIRL